MSRRRYSLKDYIFFVLYLAVCCAIALAIHRAKKDWLYVCELLIFIAHCIVLNNIDYFTSMSSCRNKILWTVLLTWIACVEVYIFMSKERIYLNTLTIFSFVLTFLTVIGIFICSAKLSKLDDELFRIRGDLATAIDDNDVLKKKIESLKQENAYLETRNSDLCVQLDAIQSLNLQYVDEIISLKHKDRENNDEPR